MSAPQRVRGVKILKAISSPLRLQILNYLFDKGPLSYTELMSSLKMNPSRDAGRFAYHLKFLLKADLAEADVNARKYCLTELGKMVIDVADRIEKRAFKPKGMLVRTSRLALEEFDANRIATSLMRETKMPAELAQRVAKEAEGELLKSKTKYLSAPLVRELVNTILVEKGLEEYRHKLTRLGLPVHEVATLVESKSKTEQGASAVLETAGQTVLKEYTLLNILPRDIADAHLSGALHISDLSSWILKPNEVMHDTRFFFQNGLNLEKVDASQPSRPAPHTLESALALTLNVLLHSARETAETQTVDFFNITLAPFAKGLDPARIKEALRSFILDIAQHANVTLGLELDVPSFIAAKPAIGLQGKRAGKYGDFIDESQQLASLVLDIFAEESDRKPLFNPSVVAKIRSETFADKRAEALLLKAHALAAEKGVPYFANLSRKGQTHSVFSASGCRLSADLNEDWETDTLRTGCLGSVLLNLPRIAYECEKDKNKFQTLLKERLELAARALEMKNRALRQHGRGLLPFLMQGLNGDQYFRLENCSSIVNIAGFKEAVEAFSAKSFDSEETLQFAEQVTESILAFMPKMSRKLGKRLFPAMLPSSDASERLAQLDIERYGVAKVRFSGTREKPYYSTTSRLLLQEGTLSPEALRVEQRLSKLHAGGSLTIVELGEAEFKPADALALTKQLVEAESVGLFAYRRRMTYCANCRHSWFGTLHKCPSCGAVGTLTVFDRFAYS